MLYICNSNRLIMGTIRLEFNSDSKAKLLEFHPTGYIKYFLKYDFYHLPFDIDIGNGIFFCFTLIDSFY